MRSIIAAALLCLLTSGCAALRAPASDQGVSSEDKPWQVRCETARKLDVDLGDAPAAQQIDWVFGRDLEGQPYTVDGKLVNIPPLYPDELGAGNCVTRVVVFGDSLTDTGTLKQRLKVFPGRPYWIGRFSKGPVWPEYRGMATGLGVQSHAYGGASATRHDALPGASVYAQIRDFGQFFVSGSIELQINDYIQQTLADGHIERVDTTAFLIWGGAGARRFVMIDLPDLGHTPIVLQNTTYVPEHLEMNDTARRIEPARRLTQVSIYHNQLLDEAVE